MEAPGVRGLPGPGGTRGTAAGHQDRNAAIKRLNVSQVDGAPRRIRPGPSAAPPFRSTTLRYCRPKQLFHFSPAFLFLFLMPAPLRTMQDSVYDVTMGSAFSAGQWKGRPLCGKKGRNAEKERTRRWHKPAADDMSGPDGAAPPPPRPPGRSRRAQEGEIPRERCTFRHSFVHTNTRARTSMQQRDSRCPFPLAEARHTPRVRLSKRPARHEQTQLAPANRPGFLVSRTTSPPHTVAHTVAANGPNYAGPS